MELSKGETMFITTSTTCTTCERPAVKAYSNGEGEVDFVCGYHDYLLTRVAEFCTTCNQQKYVGSCFCE